MRKSTVPAEAGRLTAADWVDAACRAIAAGGVGAVAVEPLARWLGVTKGSFYWHFPNRDALLRAALERWEGEETEGVIAALGTLAGPRERLVRLIGEAIVGETEGDGDQPSSPAGGAAFNLAVSDAADDPIVQPVLRRVSERRIAYLEESFGALGLSPAEARYRALLGYTAYLGALRLTREAPERLPRGEERGAYHRHLIGALLPDEGEDVG